MTTLRLILIRAILPAALILAAWSQQGSRPDPKQMLEQFKKRSIEAETAGLAEPFKGITTNGTVQPGLYAIKSTGVTTEPVRKAAAAFLAALTPEQRQNTKFPVDDVEWRKWMNQDFYIRQGMGFVDMTDPQREAAFAMIDRKSVV